MGYTFDRKSPEKLAPVLWQALIFAAILLAATSVQAQTCKAKTPEYLADLVVKSFQAHDLHKLDTLGLTHGQIALRITHTLLEGQFKTTRMSGLAGFERWVKAYRGAQDAPLFFNALPLQSCAKGLCTFEGGTLHNQLYIFNFRYQPVNGCPKLTAIEFWDGD